MVTTVLPLRRAPRGTQPLTIPPLLDRVELCAAFDRALATVGERWPDAPVRDDAFAEYVCGHVGTERDLSARLPRLRINDMFLAWWAMTSPAGVAAFLAEFGDELSREVACITSRYEGVDARMLLDHLIGELFDGDEPRIVEFSGFGSLRAWVEVVAAQMFLDVARAFHG